MYADAVDDEFQARQAHAGVRQLGELEGELGITDVHGDLDAHLGHLAALAARHLERNQAVVDVAGVAFRAGNGDLLAVLQLARGVAAADDRRDAELARDDGGVAGAPAAVGDDRRRHLHHRLPVRVGHVSHQHVAGLDPVHLRGVGDDAHGAAADLVADGAPFGDYARAALQGVALLDVLLARLDRLGPGLQHVDLAV